ncbi:DUF5994 family protein [Pseudonocardia halophobica]|uniref:DUF5994 family protein n=1 Tax=Pseudonocardia halophobica TaxID=29401 RepID=UPI003D937BFA
MQQVGPAPREGRKLKVTEFFLHVGGLSTSTSANSDTGRSRSGTESTDMASVALTSTPIPTPVASAAASDESRARLSVKSVGSGTTGQVDGAWWPHSRGLVEELSNLLPLLLGRLGRVERVSYRLGEWDPAARKADVGGERIRLAGFNSKAAHTVDVLAEQHRVTLLVIPPDTAPALAPSVLEAAGTDGNADSIAALLAAAGLSN